MPFRPPKKQPQFADLKGILAQYREPDNALYQTVQLIIERLDQLRDTTNDAISRGDDETKKKSAPVGATYLTTEDETFNLPQSVQLLAGTGITFDDSLPNTRVISSLGGGASNHYDSPLTDGNIDETELIFASGNCIIVQVPL